jgi:phosphopantothenoylcysteine decarboxylase/phosphopantothenate--cysteine ligase
MSEPDTIVEAALAAAGSSPVDTSAVVSQKTGRSHDTPTEDAAVPARHVTDRSFGAASAGLDRPADLAGRRVLITAGGTREPLDPVRYLANRSSGKQGVAFALAAAARGAEVTVIAAHLDAEPAAALASSGLETVEVVTAADLAAVVAERAGEASVVVMAAAVADFTPAEVSERKIKKTTRAERIELGLVRTPDILGGLVAQPVAGRIVVGFAAETAADRDELIGFAREKLERKRPDILVANAVGEGRGFGTDDNSAVVLAGSGEVLADVSGTKREVADRVLDEVVPLLH